MLQRTDLNRSRLPASREQVQPSPVVQASGSDITSLQEQIDALTTRMEAAEASIADHESRITALEP